MGLFFFEQIIVPSGQSFYLLSLSSAQEEQKNPKERENSELILSFFLFLAKCTKKEKTNKENTDFLLLLRTISNDQRLRMTKTDPRDICIWCIYIYMYRAV